MKDDFKTKKYVYLGVGDFDRYVMYSEIPPDELVYGSKTTYVQDRKYWRCVGYQNELEDILH